MILSTCEYMGSIWELVVLTDTEAEGRKALKVYIDGQDLGFQYYKDSNEYLDELMNQIEIVKGTVLAL